MAIEVGLLTYRAPRIHVAAVIRRSHRGNSEKQRGALCSVSMARKHNSKANSRPTRVYVVHATWDDEAKVWVAESADVPGLVTEAPTTDDLAAKLCMLVLELLEANGCLPKEF